MKKMYILVAILLASFAGAAWQFCQPRTVVALQTSAHLTHAEQTFVGFVRGEIHDEKVIQGAIDEFKRASREEPNPPWFGNRHYWAYAEWAQEKLGQQTAQITVWDRALLLHLEKQPDPAEAIIQLAEAREGLRQHDQLSQLYHQWSIGLFSQNRSQQLLATVGQYIDLTRLQGQTVADIGAGPGQLARALIDVVGDKGHVLAIDTDKSVDDAQAQLAKIDPKYGEIFYRFVQAEEWNPGIRWEDQVGAAFLMDVHILGIRDDAPPRQVEEQVTWLNRVYDALKPGGTLFIYEGGGAAPPLPKVLPVFHDSRFGTKVVGHPISHRYGASVQEGYVVVATK